MMADGIDPRNLRHGLEIPSKAYCDQPYIVTTDDGAWLCVLTTGSGREGDHGQQVVAIRSTDRGTTWSEPVPLEGQDGRENSYAVLLKAPSGRVFCFYNHNTDNLRAVKADDPPYPGGLCYRVDSLGHFVLRFSDDHGRTWSDARTPIPVRAMEIDRNNAYAGAVRFFWNVGKPFLKNSVAYVPLHKVGGFGGGFFTCSEGVLLRSANLLTVENPVDAGWETLPDGDRGIRTPPHGGPIAEEHSFAVLSDGSFYVIFRTVDGHPACSYSRDDGRTWSVPEYQRYADGRVMKHPRAANFVWRCGNGRYLYWFHNHGGRFVREMTDPMKPYADRNPAWLCGGIETQTPAGSVIRWSQPEIVLYDDDPYVRMSYPDLVEATGCYYLTETQKDIARTHEVDTDLIEGLWSQGEREEVATHGLLLSLPDSLGVTPAQAKMPQLPHFLERDPHRSDYGTRDLRAGLSLEVWLRLVSLRPGQTVLDSRTPDGRGLSLQTSDRETLEIVLNDGRTECRWDCDPGVLVAGQRHHVIVNVDGGPKIITFVVNGALCDGADFRQFGWGRFSPHLRDADGGDTLRLGQPPTCFIESVRIYGRCLRTSEAISNFRAGRQSEPA